MIYTYSLNSLFFFIYSSVLYFLFIFFKVHIPRQVKGSAPIFGHHLLEFLTKTPWWVIPIVYIPITLILLSRSLSTPLSLSSPSSPSEAADAISYLNPLIASVWFMGGIFVWSLIEYSLHRFLFHIDEYLPDHPVALTLHFLLHGVHHFLPMDR